VLRIVPSFPDYFCDSGTVIWTGGGQSNNHFYHVSLKKMTYNGSLMYAAAMPPCCEGESAHVVTISNEAETEFLTTILPEADQTVWIGLDDKDGDGQYAWVKGEALTYRQAAVLEYPAGLCASYKEADWSPVSCLETFTAVFEYDCA